MSVTITKVATGEMLELDTEYLLDYSIERDMEDVSVPGEQPMLIAIGGVKKRIAIRYVLTAEDDIEFRGKIAEIESVFGTANICEKFTIKITEWWGDEERDCLVPLVTVTQRAGEPLKAEVEIRVMIGEFTC